MRAGSFTALGMATNPTGAAPGTDAVGRIRIMLCLASNKHHAVAAGVLPKRIMCMDTVGALMASSLAPLLPCLLRALAAHCPPAPPPTLLP